MMDGRMVSFVYDTGEGISSDQNFCANLTAGNHMLEMYGVESCCDETSAWRFNVNGGDWMEFSTANLALFMELPAVEGDTTVEFGTVEMMQPDEGTWYQISIEGTFNKPVVVLGPLSFNGGHPVTVRV